MPHVALPGFSFSQAINLLMSFAGSVFRATIHSGVRHRFEKCCMVLRRKTTHSPKIGKTHNAHAHVLVRKLRGAPRHSR